MTPGAQTVYTAAVCGLTLLGVGFGRLPGVRLNRAAVAVAGAAALVTGGSAPLGEALAFVNGEVLVLLFALMVVNAALSGAGAFRLLTLAATRRVIGPRRLLLLLVLSAGVSSALFLNDTVVLMLTPLVVRAARRLGLPPLPYLLALALAANAGSVATVTGNPQNVLVGVTAGIGYLPFAARLGPVALAGLAVSAGAVLVAFRRELRVPLRVATPEPLPEVDRVRLGTTVTVALAMLAAFVAGAPVVVVALAAAAVLLMAHGPRAGALLRHVDYELLVLFAGLFVVVGVLAASGWPTAALAAWRPAGPGTSADSAAGLAALTAVTAGLSTMVSNVPAVLMLLPGLDLPALAPAARQATALTVAMASTLAGNLTLVASVANLIVAESARRLGVEVGFWAYLRVGLPVTLVTLTLGWLWVVTW